MATLSIIKYSNKVWKFLASDVPTGANGFSFSKLQADSDGLDFFIVSQGGATTNRYQLANVTVYPSVGGVPETGWLSMQELLLRLEELNFPAWNAVSGSGGATAFIQLTDAPDNYTSQGGKVVAVKEDETGLEFIEGGGGSTPTLQEVLDNNHDLVDEIFNAGTRAGENNTGTNQNAFGLRAGKDNVGINQNALGERAGEANTGDNQNTLGSFSGESNSGVHQNALGQYAGQNNTGRSQNALGNGAGQDNSGINQNALGELTGVGNTGNDVNALGYNAGGSNTGDSVNALGASAGSSNSGTNVNALGSGAGNSNTFEDVNLFGQNAQADENGQTVLSKDGTIMARISTADLTDTHKYNLPDADGTIALTSDITAATSLEAVTTNGKTTTKGVTLLLPTSGDALDSSLIVKLNSAGYTNGLILGHRQSSGDRTGFITLQNVEDYEQLNIDNDKVNILTDTKDINYLFDKTKSNGNYTLATTSDIPPAITIDATPTDGSANAVSSNGVFDALALKQDVVSGVSDTEIGYLDGVTSAIQTQINAKFTLPTLTSGSVLFSNGSTIAQDNSQLFWDDTNKRLGIGTNVPTVRCQINYSTSAFTNGLEIRNTTNTVRSIVGLALRDAANELRAAFQFIPSTATDAGALVNTAIFASTSASKLAFIANSGGISSSRQDIYFNCLNTVTNMYLFGATGNLTIQNGGTFTDAGFRLDVNGTTRLNGNTSIGGAAAGARLDVRAQGALSTDIAFRVRNSADSANILTVQGNGNVGIGNITPTQAFEVKGVSKFITGNSDPQIKVARNLGQGIGEIQFGDENQSNVIIGGSQVNGMRYFSEVHHSFFNNTIEGLRIFNSTRNVQIQNGGTYTEITSARFAVNSTTQGFLPPRMTNAQRLAIASPAVGLIVYCTDVVEGLYINKSTGWTFVI